MKRRSLLKILAASPLFSLFCNPAEAKQKVASKKRDVLNSNRFSIIGIKNGTAFVVLPIPEATTGIERRTIYEAYTAGDFVELALYSSKPLNFNGKSGSDLHLFKGLHSDFREVKGHWKVSDVERHIDTLIQFEYLVEGFARRYSSPENKVREMCRVIYPAKAIAVNEIYPYPF